MERNVIHADPFSQHRHNKSLLSKAWNFFMLVEQQLMLNIPWCSIFFRAGIIMNSPNVFVYVVFVFCKMLLEWHGQRWVGRDIRYVTRWSGMLCFLYGWGHKEWRMISNFNLSWVYFIFQSFGKMCSSMWKLCWNNEKKKLRKKNLKLNNSAEIWLNFLPLCRQCSE